MTRYYHALHPPYTCDVSYFSIDSRVASIYGLTLRDITYNMPYDGPHNFSKNKLYSDSIGQPYSVDRIIKSFGIRDINGNMIILAECMADIGSRPRDELNIEYINVATAITTPKEILIPEDDKEPPIEWYHGNHTNNNNIFYSSIPTEKSADYFCKIIKSIMDYRKAIIDIRLSHS